MKVQGSNIHIWQAELDLLISDTYKPEILSADERERASKFRFDHHRERFIKSRAVLRQLVGHYLKCKGSDVVFSYTPLGKPYLKDYDLHFNMSHSGSMAYMAFAKYPVGIDIELETNNKLEVAQRFFTYAENEQLNALSTNNQTPAFFQLWTKKEALLKAFGLGLTQSLNSFSLIATAEKQQAALAGERITILSLPTPAGYHAAIASFELTPQLEYYAFAEKMICIS